MLKNNIQNKRVSNFRTQKTSHKSRIRDPDKAKQLIDFRELEIDGYIYPTDIDGLIEYKDSEYIIFEIKHGSAEVPAGQRLALQRMVDDFTKIGKRAVVFICEHSEDDTNKPIIAAWCKVRELYCGNGSGWRHLAKDISVREAVNMFHEHFLEEVNKE